MMAHFEEEYLLENQAPTDVNIAVFKAALAGSLTGVTNALAKGAKPNYFHHPEVVAVCLMLTTSKSLFSEVWTESSINGFISVQDNKNALHVAAEQGYLEIVEVLLRAGAIVDSVAITSQVSVGTIVDKLENKASMHVTHLRQHRCCWQLKMDTRPSFRC
jgi:hypothetical protein